MAKQDDLMLTWVSLVHLGTWLPQQLDRHFSDQLGISLAEQDLLAQLHKASGEIRLSELADRLFLSKPGMTRMLDRLEASKLAERVATRSDRRAMSAKLTKKGESLLQQSKELLYAWVVENFGVHLNAAEMKTFSSLLEKVLKSLGRWEGQLAHLKGESASE